MPAEDLRREVFRSSAERVGCVRVLHIELAQAEVAQGDVTGVVQQDVLRFEIAVSDVGTGYASVRAITYR